MTPEVLPERLIYVVQRALEAARSASSLGYVTHVAVLFSFSDALHVADRIREEGDSVVFRGYIPRKD